MVTTASQIGATRFTTPSDLDIVISRVFNAPRQRVWVAWTSPEHLRRWMLGPGGWTMPVCEVDLRPGGAWHFGWCHENGSEMAMRGSYREIAMPERLVSTESWGGDWPETINTLAFQEEEGQTTVTQTILYPSMEARDAALGTGMKQGVALSFDRLSEYLQTMA